MFTIILLISDKTSWVQSSWGFYLQMTGCSAGVIKKFFKKIALLSQINRIIYKYL